MISSIVGGTLLAGAYYCFSRADAAAQAASAANCAIAQEDDLHAYRAGIEAKSAWLASRIASNALVLKSLRELQEKRVEDAKKDAKAVESLEDPKKDDNALPHVASV